MKYLFVILISIWTFACKNKTTTVSAQSDVYYTCSMHPEVKESKPGLCPICKMELIAVKKGSTQVNDEIELSTQQIQLGNIHVDTIRGGKIGAEMILPGTLNFDQLKTNAVSARVAGRIEKLYFKNIGEYISKGVKLFEIYSEELNNAKQEYLLAIEKEQELGNTLVDFSQLVESAKNKLLLWGMSHSQLREIETSKKASTLTPFYASTSGFITSIDMQEGDYAMEGGTIFRLADLSSLWAEAQVYSSQLSSIGRGAQAIVRFPNMAGKEIFGKIEFENPEINPGTRINLVRVPIMNPGNQLKPGMQAYVVIRNREQYGLSLPIDAVIRDAKGASVWVQVKENTFKSKMVELGVESNDRVEITSGLQEGDVVVISGAYLLNSEYIFTRGTSPMAGMSHGL